MVDALAGYQLKRINIRIEQFSLFTKQVFLYVYYMINVEYVSITNPTLNGMSSDMS